ncbi:MAG: zinc-dependent metalloprotease [Cyclobacteriaceae bacterium]|nr:zinc-dependent metalloprotease [Cyclobacteriaceae bacterium]
MKKILLLVLLVQYVAFTLPAQNNECGTPDISENEYMALPWYGDEDDTFLNNFYDSLENAMGNPAARGVVQDVWWRIPVQFWIYRVNANTPGGTDPLPTEVDIQTLMDDANEAFRNNGIKIQFYLDCYEYVNNVAGITVNGFGQESLLANAYRRVGAINVHVVDNIPGAAGKFNILYNAIFIRREISFTQNDAQTFSHELGHCFGLLHTHFGAGVPCLREPVTRGRKVTLCPNGPGYTKRCNWTGDLLCDTPADPEMNNINAPGCTYTQGETDHYGDTYVPDTRNYMAVGNRGCRNNFSSGQIKWMYWWLKNVQVPLSSGANWYIVSNNTAFDIYEPDNWDITARAIAIGEVQEHSFFGAAPGNCDDTADWLRFQYPASGSSGLLRLEIRDVDTPNPVDEINVYLQNVNGTAGAQLTNLTTTVLTGMRIVELTCATLTPGQQYLVEITRDQNNIGKYEVALIDIAASLPISGPSLVCTNGSTFMLNNVPVGVQVTWQATPANLFQTSSGTLPTGVNTLILNAANNNVSGQGTLTFTINSNCGNQLQVERTIWVGLTQYLYFSASYSQSQGILLSTPYVGGGATAQWSVNGVQHAGFDIFVQPLCIDYTNIPLEISLTVENQCDLKTVCTQYILKCPPSPLLTNMGSCGGGGGEEPEFHEEYQYSVSPNPTNQLLSISVITNSDSRKTSESSTTESKSVTTIQSIALTDINGFIKYSRQYSNGPTKAEIDVSDLRKGVYMLRVSNGKHIEIHRVIID